MRKTITGLLLAATLAPGVAMAGTSRGELARDRQDVREERREYNDARRYGDRGDIREERHEYNDARRELREDRRDWRDARYYDRRYVHPGVRVYSSYYAPRYYVARPGDYRLPRAYRYQRWVRHSGDFLLIDTRNGRVVRVVRG
jgi:Ni/Co efflux regulator RcnB